VEKNKELKMEMKQSRPRLLFIAAGLFFLLCLSCQSGKTKIEKPKDLLERKAFEAVLLDVYLIEGDVRYRIRMENFDSLQTRITAEVNAMYKKHHTSHEQFMSSYAYYVKDPNLSEEIMKHTVDKLVDLQAKEEAKPQP
jgi:hypothetical protein